MPWDEVLRLIYGMFIPLGMLVKWPRKFIEENTNAKSVNANNEPRSGSVRWISKTKLLTTATASTEKSRYTEIRAVDVLDAYRGRRESVDRKDIGNIAKHRSRKEKDDGSTRP